MSINKEQWEFVKDINKLLNFIINVSIYKEIEGDGSLFITFGEVFRTNYQQKQYVKEGLSKTMNSAHLKRLAIDLNFFVDNILTYDKEDIESFGEFWCNLNDKNIWGGNFSFNDSGHFERNP